MVFWVISNRSFKRALPCFRILLDEKSSLGIATVPVLRRWPILSLLPPSHAVTCSCIGCNKSISLGAEGWLGRFNFTVIATKKGSWILARWCMDTIETGRCYFLFWTSLHFFRYSLVFFLYQKLERALWRSNWWTNGESSPSQFKTRISVVFPSTSVVSMSLPFPHSPSSF